MLQGLCCPKGWLSLPLQSVAHFKSKSAIFYHRNWLQLFSPSIQAIYICGMSCSLDCHEATAIGLQAFQTYKLGGKMSELLYSPAAYGIDLSSKDMPKPRKPAICLSQLYRPPFL